MAILTNNSSMPKYYDQEGDKSKATLKICLGKRKD